MISNENLEKLLNNTTDNGFIEANSSFVREMAKIILAQREYIAQNKTYILQLERIVQEESNAAIEILS